MTLKSSLIVATVILSLLGFWAFGILGGIVVAILGTITISQVKDSQSIGKKLVVGFIVLVILGILLMIKVIGGTFALLGLLIISPLVILAIIGAIILSIISLIKKTKNTTDLLNTGERKSNLLSIILIIVGIFIVVMMMVFIIPGLLSLGKFTCSSC